MDKIAHPNRFFFFAVLTIGSAAVVVFAKSLIRPALRPFHVLWWRPYAFLGAIFLRLPKW
jgi:hypothetical protein